jgi:hypothetical protein
METAIRHLGDLKFEATARAHRVVCDQPAENGGSDAGMSRVYGRDENTPFYYRPGNNPPNFIFTTSM